MPIYRAPTQDFTFLLKEYLDIGQYADVPGFGAETQELIDPLLAEGARFCEEVLFPLNQKGDEEGLRFEDGQVYMPEGFREAYEQYVQGGWPAFACDPDYGGQGLPEVMAMPMIEMICSANLSFGITPGLSHGAYNAMALHASDELKQKYLPKLVSGEWAGVMDLTEPQCGTDLGLIRTKAEPNEDGSYTLEGTKIFISSGEQDLTDNILHLVLARLPDAPKGTKGISLFLVPKMLVHDDGSLGERNGVTCASIEHKMGIHASPTCVINFDGAKGWLVGEPNKGMRNMFTMMNAARLYVGVQGLGLAEVAWQNALAYANERLQGRALKKPAYPEKAADPIVVHPDVRRMLLTMKSFCEGARALAMETALMLDLSRKHGDEKVRQEADHFVQLVTPILKAYYTDMGFEVTNLAMQVYGGHGYIREHGIEQYVRDARIAQIYEGANGIQGLDLIGRKLPYKFGRYLRNFFHPAVNFCEAHKDNEQMQEFVKPLRKHIGFLQQGSFYMAQAGVGNVNDAAAAATEYLRMFALVWLGLTWARMADVALQKLEAGEGDAEFYEDKLATARFYMQRILPGTVSPLMAMTQGSKSLMGAKLSVE